MIALLVAVAAAGIIRFEVYCVTDILAADDRKLRYFTKRGWIAVSLLSVPLGGIAYFLLGKAANGF